MTLTAASLSEAPPLRDTLALSTAGIDHAPVRWTPVLLFVSLSGCPRAAEHSVAVDAGLAAPALADAGAVVTEARVDAWLGWQRALAALPAPGRDGGLDLRQRAREEARLLAAAGLTDDQADAIEAVVAAVVAERNVSKLTGADALAQFKAGVQQLAPEQRAKAEAALSDLQAKTTQGSLTAVEAQYGSDAVRVILSREAEVTKTWDALLEARGDKR
jgi:hypothetical protein